MDPGHQESIHPLRDSGEGRGKATSKYYHQWRIHNVWKALWRARAPEPFTLWKVACGDVDREYQ